MFDLTGIVELKRVKTDTPVYDFVNDKELPEPVQVVNSLLAEGWKLLDISHGENEDHSSYISYYLLGRCEASEADK